MPPARSRPKTKTKARPKKKAARSHKVATARIARDLLRSFEEGPIPSALMYDGRIVSVNGPFALALGLSIAKCKGRLFTDLLPPEGGAGAVVLPGPGSTGSYRTSVPAGPVRVHLASPLHGRPPLMFAILRQFPGAVESPQAQTLLSFSRESAAAPDEEALANALAHALEGLFPGRSYYVRLLDASLAVKTSRSRGRFLPGSADRLALRLTAVQKTGLSAETLRAAGISITERDEPLFEGCERAMAVPIVVSGQLMGVLNLERSASALGDRQLDEPVLIQVANQAAVAVRNLRSLEEVTYLKAYLEDLIENANALIMVINREGEVIVFNRAFSRLTGHARPEVLGESFQQLVAEPDRALLGRVVEQTLEGEPETGFELRLETTAQKEARIGANSSPIYGASGAVEGVMIIGQDRTLLSALQDRAEHAQKLAEIGRLAAGIVHELNNPLTAVVAYADSLLQKLSVRGHDPADLEKLRRILEAGQRIQRFSRDLIAYARPASHNPEVMDVSQVVKQAAQMCEPLLRSVGARVEQHFEPVPAIKGVPGSLLQVFVNLITNAAHALPPEGGTILLELAAVGDHVVAKVKDSGQGMSPDVKKRVFEPFFTTKSDGKGSGLGLSIVQTIVSRHGGAITFDSAPGEGTTFTVMFPVKPARS